MRLLGIHRKFCDRVGCIGHQVGVKSNIDAPRRPKGC